MKDTEAIDELREMYEACKTDGTEESCQALEHAITILQQIEDGEYVKVVRCGKCKYSEPKKDYKNIVENTLHCNLWHGDEILNCWNKKTKQYDNLSLVYDDEFCMAGEAAENAKGGAEG